MFMIRIPHQENNKLNTWSSTSGQTHQRKTQFLWNDVTMRQPSGGHRSVGNFTKIEEVMSLPSGELFHVNQFISLSVLGLTPEDRRHVSVRVVRGLRYPYPDDSVLLIF